MARIAGCPLVKINASLGLEMHRLVRRQQMVAQLPAPTRSLPELEIVRCTWRTVVSPVIWESSRAVSMPFGLNATRVSQFDVIVSSWP